MLDSIVKGQEKTSFILIKDTFEESGLPLLPVFLSALVNREERGLLVCVERGEGEWRTILPPALTSRLSFLNATRREDIADLVTGKRQKETSEASVVVIDSLASLCLFHDSSLVSRFIHFVTRTGGRQVVGLLHADCVGEGVGEVLEYVATCAVTLQSPRRHRSWCAATRLTKASGKVLKATEEFSITAACGLGDVSEVHVTNCLAAADAQEVDPTAGLTFNLKLTEEQQSARSRVALPYTISTDSQKQILEHGHAQIFYQPDDADDFDEEDPDDDLDI